MTQPSARLRRVYVGLGANLGDGHAALRSALDALRALPGTRVAAVSALYRSAPVDATGPAYWNAAAELSTSLEPLELLDAMQAIEAAHGRERPYCNAPRTLDLDLLLVDNERIDHPRLTAPHPRLAGRAFVIRPLLDLDPAMGVPGVGPLAEVLPHLADQLIERVAETV